MFRGQTAWIYFLGALVEIDSFSSSERGIYVHAFPINSNDMGTSTTNGERVRTRIAISPSYIAVQLALT